MIEPWFSIVLALHVFFAIVGFGALFMTGTFSSKIRRVSDPQLSEAIRRFFRPGTNFAARALFIVPVLGAVLLALGHGRDVSMPYPWIGLGLWLVVAGVATAGIWPGEKRIQMLLRRKDLQSVRGELDALARRLERLATLTTICFVAAVVIMIAQPR